MTDLRTRLQLWAPALAIVGGLVWIGFAILGMLQPGGQVSGAGGIASAEPDAVRWAIGLAGVALICLAGALVGGALRAELPRRSAGRVGMVLGAAGGLAGFIGAASALFMWTQAGWAAVLLGTLAISGAALLMAVDAGRAAGDWVAFALLGVLGVLAAGAPTLVAVVPWLIPVHGALVMAVYGFTWVLYGNGLVRR